LSSSSRVMMIRSGTDGDVLGCAGQAQGDGTVAHRDRLGHAVDVVAIEFADGLDGNGDVMVDGLVGAFLGGGRGTGEELGRSVRFGEDEMVVLRRVQIKAAAEGVAVELV